MDNDARSNAAAADPTRRKFLELASAVFGSLVVVLLADPLVGALIDPASHREFPFAWVGAVDSLAPGTPALMSFDLHFAEGPRRRTEVRQVWAVRQSATEIEAYSPSCPRCGRQVAWDARARRFACPGDGSAFALDGTVVRGPAPRPLDSLPTRIDSGELFVQWERFRAGAAQKIPA